LVYAVWQAEGLFLQWNVLNSDVVALANRNQSGFPGEAMPESDPLVSVIDDDPALRESVGRLLRSVGVEARLFTSVPDFLNSDRPNGPTCLILDIRLPGRSGLDLQRELAAADIQIPIIFITATSRCLYRR
jgi:CheY-like chemotaxis protein